MSLSEDGPLTGTAPEPVMQFISVHSNDPKIKVGVLT